jgi:hypothetical protein
MEETVQFLYKGKLYQCEAYIDYTEFPCFVFIILSDKGLVKDFGDEITIKTDLENLLPRKDDYPELVELRKAIFNAVKYTRRFLQIKQEALLLKRNA